MPVSDLVVGHEPQIEVSVPPQGHTRDAGSKPCSFWERKSSPSSEGSPKPDKQANWNEGDTNVDRAPESNVNVGFGSKTVDPFSPPRVKNSIADWDEFGLMSPIMRNESRTEAEIPPSKLALVSSPPLLHFREMDEGDFGDEGGTRSAFREHVRVQGLSRTPLRYVRNSSYSEVGNSFTPSSHSALSSSGVSVDAVDVANDVVARVSVRQGGCSQGVSGEEQRVQFRFSPANVHPHIDKVDHLGEPPETAVVDPESDPSDSEVRSCSPTARSLSPRTEVLPASRFSSTVCDDNGATPALRWWLQPDGLNEMMAGKTTVGVGVIGGHQPHGRLSTVAVDGLDDGKEKLCWAGADAIIDSN